MREEIAARDLVDDSALSFESDERRKTFIRSLIPLTEAERRTLIEDRQQSLVGLHDPKTAAIRDGKSLAEALLHSERQAR